MKIDNSLITTARLLLRNYEAKDCERVHFYGSDSEFSKYEVSGPNSLDDTQKFVADMVNQVESDSRFKFDLAICLKENGLLIGGCSIRRETELSKVANLGWAINPDFQNKGYATEAARAVINFGFFISPSREKYLRSQA